MTDARSDRSMVLDAICAQIAKLSGTAPTPSRVRIQVGEVCVELDWPTSPPSSIPYPENETETDHNGTTGQLHVRAPLVGTFYHAPAPDAPAFVRPGDQVRPGQQVGTVEAMKLMNPVLATDEGTVTEILVANGEPVEYDQPLIALTSELS